MFKKSDTVENVIQAFFFVRVVQGAFIAFLFKRHKKPQAAKSLKREIDLLGGVAF